MSDARVIAFYLPQYHPTPLNDKFYGKGFTEWTSVGKAKPMFPGHDQPKVPADLGYYDLRMPEIREKQAEMARQAGIEGFCYYHYWFGNHHVELERPFQEVVASGKPDLPFCLCWANQSWYAKFWSYRAQNRKTLVAEQKYDDPQGIEAHFRYLLPAFKDRRYIKVDGKLLFMIYRPLEYPGVQSFMTQWQELARKEGLRGFYFMGQAPAESEVKSMFTLGLDGVNLVRLNDVLLYPPYSLSWWKKLSKIQRGIAMAFYRMTGISACLDNSDFGGGFAIPYAKAIAAMNRPDGIETANDVFPTIVPNWDHSPRSGRRAYMLCDSTPALFAKHVKQLLNIVKNKPENRKILFLKSWNEWGEGNYMEPDLKFGMGYIEALSQALNSDRKK